MEFTLRTPDGFRGRIYTYKHYDRPHCYIRGNGGRNNVLRIPGANGFPNCGTEQVRVLKIHVKTLQIDFKIHFCRLLEYILLRNRSA